ncbi:hypothetical protein K3495_g9955 [Podosphaera aphanis]|nr:hypothetical protein K3495_g9955 [Podosphaera aphanis]
MSRLSLPPVTRVLLLVLLFQSLLGFALRFHYWTQYPTLNIAWLTFIPSASFIYPWTLLTTTLVEKNVVSLVLAGVTIFFGGRYLERAWTSVEFAKFLLVASLIPNLFCVGTLTTLAVITGDARWTLLTINGTIPLQISFLVAFAQLVPAHTVTLFKGMISLRVSRFPLLHVTTIFLLALTPILSAASFILSVSGFIATLVYLRFYKKAFPDLQRPQSSLRGDASESLALAEFFPDPMKPFITNLSNKMYMILVRLRICTPYSTADDSASRGDLYMQRGTPGSARAEAERRRALALKALDQRLHAASASHSKNHNVPLTTVGPRIQVQPQPNKQASNVLLGETNYVPESEEEEALR